MQLFINGQKVGQSAQIPVSLGTSSNPIHFGGRALSSPETPSWYAGQLDSLRLWNRGLEDYEISALFYLESPQYLSIAQHPQGGIYSAGTAVNLSVSAVGIEPLSYQWFRNGQLMSSATNSALNFPSIQPVNAGNYYVIVTNSLGSLTSQVAMLTVETTFSRISNGTIVNEGGHGFGVAWGDYDGDGWPDLYVANEQPSPGTNYLYHNNGNGTFTKITTGIIATASGANSRGAAWADYDNDGRLDLYVANCCGGDNFLFHNLGGGNFALISGAEWVLDLGGGAANAPSWVDYDRDGYLDLFVANYATYDNALFQNKGNGTFLRVTNGAIVSDGGISIAGVWGDYDGDGWPDVFVSNDGGNNFLYRNNTNGTFTKITNGSIVNDGGNHTGAAWGDFDNDGDLDLVVGKHPNQRCSLYQNNGGSFGEIANASGLGALGDWFAVAWGDYDNDGWLDLAVANRFGTNVMYRNNRDGTFTSISAGSIGQNGVAAAFADYDHDGFLDLFLSNTAGNNHSLYHNNGNSNAWLRVRCLTSAGNRDAIGATVRMRAKINGADIWQRRDIISGEGYNSQNELIAHFGLGDATNIDLLRIEWPSGKVQQFTNITPRQLLTIQEETKFYFAVQGGGAVSYAPAKSNYFVGELITLTANTNRYYRFVQWSDGNTNAVRNFTVSLSNYLACIFTNIVPLEELVIKEWEADFGGSDNDYLTSLKQTSDGGYVMGGYSYSITDGNKASAGFGGSDFWVVRLDRAGNKVWDRCFGGAGEDQLYALDQTADGGFMLGGWSASTPWALKSATNYGGWDFWVVRLDANGIQLWDKSFGGTNDDLLYDLQITWDGGCFLSGDSSSGVSGNKSSPNLNVTDYWALKLDSNGQKIWDNTFGGLNYDSAYSGRQTLDGGYVLGGSSWSPINGNKSSDNFGAADGWLLKLDAAGHKLWENPFGGSSVDFISSVRATSEGGYILGLQSSSAISGNKTNSGFGAYDFWLVKVDGAGTKQWEKVLGGGADEENPCVRQTPDGGFSVGGASSSGVSGNKTNATFGPRDFWFVRLDSNGNKKWEAAFGGSGNDVLKVQEPTADGGFVLAGYSDSGATGNKSLGGYGSADYWVVKLAVREAPIGTPVVLVNGQYSVSNNLAVTETNAAQVTLSTSFTNGTIRYTIDGSAPTTNSPLYTGAFWLANTSTITRSFTITATAWNSNATASATADPVTVSFVTRPLFLAQNGRGTVSATPAQPSYATGQQILLTATPLNSYYGFVRWSDGNTSNPRPVTIGASSNLFTAIFTNIVPLELHVLKQWEKDYGGTNADHFTVVKRTDDGGYVVAGYSDSPPSGNKISGNYGDQDFWLLKLDTNGNKQWERTFGGTNEDHLATIIMTMDGGFFLAGSSLSGAGGNKTSPGYGGRDFWTVRLDANGNKLWDQSFGGSADEVLSSGLQTVDGGFIVGGYSFSVPSGNKTATNSGQTDFWLVRLDANGNKVWDRSYGGTSYEEIDGLQQTADGGFVIEGQSSSGASGNKSSINYGNADCWVIKIDADGNKLWENDIGGSGEEDMSYGGVSLTPDGGFILCGDSTGPNDGNKTAPNHGGRDCWLIRLDAAGNKLWDRSYGGTGSDQPGSVIPVRTGGLLLGASSDSTATVGKTSSTLGGLDYWLVRLDENGTQIWDRSYGGTNDDDLSNGLETPDGGFVIGGESASGPGGNKFTTNFGNADIWLVKLSNIELPAGAPVILVNGFFAQENHFQVTDTNSVWLTLTSSIPNAHIYYTLDGNEPDFGSAIYDGNPVVVTSSTEVRAFATDDGENFQTETMVNFIDFIPSYNITNTTPGGGTITMDPPAGPYLSNRVVTLTATAANGWTFAGWSGDISGTNNPTTVTMTGNKNVKAIFTTSLFLGVSGGAANGSLQTNPVSPVYAYGQQVIVSAIPAANRFFLRWSQTAYGSNNPVAIAVTNAFLTNNALFSTLQSSNRTLTLLVNGSGFVSKSPLAGAYLTNSVVTVTATPDPGYVFTGWSGDASGTANPLNVTMTTNKVITASFAIPPVVAITSPTDGSTLTVGSFTVTTAASDADGTVTRVEFYVDGVLAGTVSNAPFNLVLSDVFGTRTLTAKAFDNSGAATVSSPVTVTLNRPVPVIYGFNPASGPVGSPVVITGVNFHAVAASNIVNFGAVRASVMAASTNSLTVVAPTGATYAPITVNARGLVAYSRLPFVQTFSSNHLISSNSFAPRYDLPSPAFVVSAALADIDGDGRLDLVAALYNSGLGLDEIAVYRNLGNPGPFGTNTFAPPVLWYAATFIAAKGFAVGDLDGDGKPDIVAVGPSTSPNGFIMRNTSVPGTIDNNSFASPILISSRNGYAVYEVAIRDLDGDGRADIVFIDGNTFVMRNIGTGPGISNNTFAAPEAIGAGLFNLAIADIDGDNRPDMLTGGSPNLTLGYRNIASPGSLSSNSFAPVVTMNLSNVAIQIATGDLDGDNKPDAVAMGAGSGGGPIVLKNMGVSNALNANSFAPKLELGNGNWPELNLQYVSLADLDGDGRPDMLFAPNTDSHAVYVVQNSVTTNGNLSPTSFGNPITLPTSSGSKLRAVVGDIDGDGRPDVIAPDEFYAIALYRNIMTDNLAPAVSLTNPVAGANFTLPATITLNATASDTDGSVLRVDYYRGALFLGTATNSPYNFTWTNAPVGTNVLTAVATDNGGLSTTSAPVSIIVQTATPFVFITSPVDGATFAASSNITVTAQVVDADNSVTNVAFFAGAMLLTNCAAPPYNVGFTWSNVAIGSYTLTARAQDSFGPTATSAPVNITVSTGGGTAPAVFTMSTNAYSVSETAGAVIVTVLKNPNGTNGVVNFSTSDGTGVAVASGVGNYINRAGSLSFAANEFSKTVSIGIRDNSSYFTGNRTFNFSLSPAGDGSSVGSPGLATVTILDSDSPPSSNSVTLHLNVDCLGDRNGQINVYLVPTNSGGQWRLAREIFWRNNGDVVSNLMSGSYEVQFRPVPGQLPPDNLTVVVPNGVPTPLQTNFPYARLLPSQPVGSLTINLIPSQGQWRLLGETNWLASGAARTNLIATNHVVEFNSLNGYATPPLRTAVVPAGPTNYTVTYQAPNNVNWFQPAAVTFNPAACAPFSGDYMNNYNGQLLTDSGFGSGCVVKRRVVLTAAHVIFDDLTLSYVPAVRWFFQRQAGQYEPPQQTPRGAYVLSGYAAARTNDVPLLGPGVSSPASQSQDIAALFFFEDAGRGGQSGYLVANDSSGIQWLQSGFNMTMIGYPVEGVSDLARGQMHSTLLTSYTFNSVTNGVFSTTTVAGHPGMSGGPLCVQYQGVYYPAGVYLGGSQQSIVRAIDAAAADLINRADVNANTGNNNTGGGVIRISPTANGAATIAYVQMTLGPSAAIAAGGGWRLLGDSNLNFQVDPNFTYVLQGTNPVAFEFKSIPGWNPPPNQSIGVTLGTVTNIAANYTFGNPVMVLNRTQGLGIIGAAGATYRIEYRTNLTLGSWLPLRTNTLGAGFNPLMPWPPTNGPAAFYRAVWLP